MTDKKKVRKTKFRTSKETCVVEQFASEVASYTDEKLEEVFQSLFNKSAKHA